MIVVKCLYFWFVCVQSDVLTQEAPDKYWHCVSIGQIMSQTENNARNNDLKAFLRHGLSCDFLFGIWAVQTPFEQQPPTGQSCPTALFEQEMK